MCTDNRECIEGVDSEETYVGEDSDFGATQVFAGG